MSLSKDANDLLHEVFPFPLYHNRTPTSFEHDDEWGRMWNLIWKPEDKIAVDKYNDDIHEWMQCRAAIGDDVGAIANAREVLVEKLFEALK